MNLNNLLITEYDNLEILDFEHNIDLATLGKAMEQVNGGIIKLRQFAANKELSLAEEIHFFKHAKPQFCAFQIYFPLLFNIELGRPAGNAGVIREYYEAEIGRLAAYFDRYRFYYEYYRLNYDHLDELFFVRGSGAPKMSPPELARYDPPFSTWLDFTFTRFIAYGHLSRFIAARLGHDTNMLDGIARPVKYDGTDGLTWTGEVVDLVELAYGLYLSGQINKGKATLTQIVAWLEQSLSSKIGRPHRHFIDISRRKRLSFTKFIDLMKNAIIKKIEDAGDI